MSNLGFQTIYDHLNALPHVVCERVFFPDPEDVDLPQLRGAGEDDRGQDRAPALANWRTSPS